MLLWITIGKKFKRPLGTLKKQSKGLFECVFSVCNHLKCLFTKQKINML